MVDAKKATGLDPNFRPPFLGEDKGRNYAAEAEAAIKNILKKDIAPSEILNRLKIFERNIYSAMERINIHYIEAVAHEELAPGYVSAGVRRKFAEKISKLRRSIESQRDICALLRLYGANQEPQIDIDSTLRSLASIERLLDPDADLDPEQPSRLLHKSKGGRPDLSLRYGLIISALDVAEIVIDGQLKYDQKESRVGYDDESDPEYEYFLPVGEPVKGSQFLNPALEFAFILSHAIEPETERENIGSALTWRRKGGEPFVNPNEIICFFPSSSD